MNLSDDKIDAIYKENLKSGKVKKAGTDLPDRGWVCQQDRE